MRADWIHNPFPVWDHIKTYLSDDSGELETKGRFIGVFDDATLAGAFLIKPWNEHCFEFHGGVGKEYWGKGAQVCDLAGRAVFYATPCLKIVAIVPEFRRPMIACLKRIGLKEEGRITKSYLKWSRLHDQIVLGITKTESRVKDMKGKLPCVLLQ